MKINGTTYRDETRPIVADILERARTLRQRVRLFYGDPDTGRDWGEEHYTIGYISRSIGPVKVPLLIANDGRSLGGGSILTANIVKITLAQGGRVLYQHPTYHQPDYSLGEPGHGSAERGYKAGVYAEYTNPRTNMTSHKENVANFKTRRQAERWIAFMTGKRNTK